MLKCLDNEHPTKTQQSLAEESCRKAMPPKNILVTSTAMDPGDNLNANRGPSIPALGWIQSVGPNDRTGSDTAVVGRGGGAVRKATVSAW